jgi:hypothetical protein
MTFASDIMVKVPAELLAQYQAAANWSAIASRIVANA